MTSKSKHTFDVFDGKQIRFEEAVLSIDNLTNAYRTVSPFVKELLSIDSRIKFAGNMISCMTYNKLTVGYLPTKKHMYFSMGGLPSYEHEIAHMCEMTNLKRCVKPDWGMPSIDKGPRYPADWSDRSYFAAASRELRVRAISSVIEGVARPTKNLLQTNPNWDQGAMRRYPIGRFKNHQDFTAWCDDLFFKTYDAWSLDRVREEWKMKLDYIRNWMETN